MQQIRMCDQLAIKNRATSYIQLHLHTQRHIKNEHALELV